MLLLAPSVGSVEVSAQGQAAPPPHPFIAHTWTADYVYDCIDTQPSFKLSVLSGQPFISNFDFGRGPDLETDRLINQAMADQTFTDVVITCGRDGLGSTAHFRLSRAVGDEIYSPSWVQVGSSNGPAKVVVRAGVVD